MPYLAMTAVIAALHTPHPGMPTLGPTTWRLNHGDRRRAAPPPVPVHHTEYGEVGAITDVHIRYGLIHARGHLTLPHPPDRPLHPRATYSVPTGRRRALADWEITSLMLDPDPHPDTHPHGYAATHHNHRSWPRPTQRHERLSAADAHLTPLGITLDRTPRTALTVDPDATLNALNRDLLVAYLHHLAATHATTTDELTAYLHDPATIPGPPLAITHRHDPGAPPQSRNRFAHRIGADPTWSTMQRLHHTLTEAESRQGRMAPWRVALRYGVGSVPA